jgi:hypothetical protein
MKFASRSGETFALARETIRRAGNNLRMILALLGAVLAVPAYADTPTFTIEFHDGKITPQRTEVPANQQFKIEFHNTGATAAEFESHKLHKEHVLAPKSRSVLVFQPLKPGEYTYFDDFHPSSGPKPVLEAK